MLHQGMLIAAVLLETLAFFNCPSGKVNFVAGGLALFMATSLIK